MACSTDVKSQFLCHMAFPDIFYMIRTEDVYNCRQNHLIYFDEDIEFCFLVPIRWQNWSRPFFESNLGCIQIINNVPFREVEFITIESSHDR